MQGPRNASRPLNVGVYLACSAALLLSARSAIAAEQSLPGYYSNYSEPVASSPSAAPSTITQQSLPTQWLSRPTCPQCLNQPWELQPGFYAGADYLYLRPSFEDATAFGRAEGLNGGPPASADLVNFNFNYQSAPRIFAGWRLDNSASIQFTYWNFDTTNQQRVSVDQPGQAIILLSGDSEPFTNIGDRILSSFSTRFNMYDIDFMRPLVFSQGAWLFTPTIGARILDYQRALSSYASDGSGNLYGFGDLQTRFVGAGPRVGIQARRYFGAARRFSLFANADGSVMIGAQNTDFRFSTGNGESILVSSNPSSNLTIAAIEVGGTWRATRGLNLSAGWLFQQWIGTNTLPVNLPFSNQGGNMSLDGLFARAAWLF